MKFFRSVIGYGLTALFVGNVWGDFTKAYGIAGGVLACVLIVSPMWYMNHYLGLIKFDKDSGYIDMGLAVGVCVFLKQAFIEKSTQSLVSAIPTLICVITGAVIGGVVAALIEKDFAKDEFEILEEQEILEENKVRNLKIYNIKGGK